MIIIQASSPSPLSMPSDNEKKEEQKDDVEEKIEESVLIKDEEETKVDEIEIVEKKEEGSLEEAVPERRQEQVGIIEIFIKLINVKHTSNHFRLGSLLFAGPTY